MMLNLKFLIRWYGANIFDPSEVKNQPPMIFQWNSHGKIIQAVKKMFKINEVAVLLCNQGFSIIVYRAHHLYSYRETLCRFKSFKLFIFGPLSNEKWFAIEITRKYEKLSQRAYNKFKTNLKLLSVEGRLLPDKMESSTAALGMVARGGQLHLSWLIQFYKNPSSPSNLKRI